ncbi:hemolysin family protein [Robertmurraya korlensis]|uniref:hemolysin family protein n=1 Tax=Robertmurraya korlensis TaxID=519977 RepID=UPI0008245589|nr:hemolysin family protein [Robertmurraya korlensis]
MSIELIILVVLILINAFFAASEIALISLNDNKIKVMADEGHKKAKMLHQLLSEPSRFLATIQIGITLAGFLASAFAAENFASDFTQLLLTLGVPLSERMLGTVSVFVITIILSYFTLVFGELVPKRLAMKKAEAISMIAVLPLTTLSKVSSPFVKLLTGSTNLIVRFFGVDPHAEDEDATEEEIKLMLDIGKERGTIQETESVMINNIFDFDNTYVTDIMTHRTNIAGIPAEATIKDVVRIVNEEKYTRFPVYEEDMDTIIGLFHVKDLIEFMEHEDNRPFEMKNIIRPPFYVIGSMRTDDVFKELQKNKTHMAIVLDEYGGTDGIVTIEDLLEEIVGNIFDEYDENEDEEIEIVKVNDGEYTILGTTSLDDVEEVLKLGLPLDQYETLSGFFIGELGRFPEQNEQPSLSFNGVQFTATQLDELRVSKIQVIILKEVENTK